ncbi:MAG: alpha-L-arabinofuranosidase C-terminal domain-containing protein [Nakamurella sp.]
MFLVNRCIDDSAEVTIDTGPLGEVEVVEALTLAETDPFAVNTVDDPDRVVPHPNSSVAADQGRVTVTLAPVSWTVLVLDSPPGSPAAQL